jgi:protein CpxP
VSNILGQQRISPGTLPNEKANFPRRQRINLSKTLHQCQGAITTMPLTPEQRTQVGDELKRFGSSLNLSDEQKEKLHTFLLEAREKVQVYLHDNPNASSADIVQKVQANREGLRTRLVNFLSPEQLSKWDAEIAKAKEFLGQKLAA